MTAACLILARAASAVAAANPNYVKLNGKYTRMSDMDITGQVQLDSNEGYEFGAAVGRSFGWLRLEAEIATQENDINNFEVRGVGGKAFRNVDTTIDSLMLNGYVDVPVADAIACSQVAVWAEPPLPSAPTIMRLTRLFPHTNWRPVHPIRSATTGVPNWHTSTWQPMIFPIT